ncbi:MAG: glycosyltransferase [Myxococcota bacterium]|nr:glycosyltransferase [Myxococcota bacterium]
MRILHVAPYAPNPRAGHSGSVLLHRTVSALAARHELLLVCHAQVSERPVLRALADAGVRVEALPIAPRGAARALAAPAALVRDRLRALQRREPSLVAKYDTVPLRRALADGVAAFRPDVALVEFDWLGRCSEGLGTLPRALVCHELGARHREQLAAESDRVRAPVERWRARAWARFERRALAGFDRLVVFTEGDARWLERWPELPPVEVIPPLPPPASEAAPRPRRASLGFLGAFDRPSNRRALERLLAEVWPRVRARVPDAALEVAGARLPATARRAIERAGGRALGFVPDLESFLGSLTVLAAPLGSGSGLNLRLAHALAAGTPVVTTSLGAEGVPAAARAGLCVADEPAALAAACAAWLLDPSAARSAGARGRAALADWARVAEARTEALLASLRAGAVRGGAAASRAASPTRPAPARG